MSYTFYDGSIAVAQDCLRSLAALIKKAQEAPNAAELVEAKLYEDMLPLTFQVHVTADTAQKIAARLTGTEPQKWQYSDLKSFEDMSARITATQEILSKVSKDVVNSRVNETVPLGRGPGKPDDQVPAHQYLRTYGLPNVFFHLNAAYCILRNKGVPLGKMDYLTPFSA